MAPQNIIDLLSVRIPWVFLGQKRRPVFLNTRTTPSLFKRTRVSSENTTLSQNPSFQPAKIQNKNAKVRVKQKEPSSSLQYHPNLASENASKVVQNVSPLIFSYFNRRFSSEKCPTLTLASFFLFFVRQQSHSDWATFLTIETTKTTTIRPSPVSGN